MVTTKLEYRHTRNIMSCNEWKSWVSKWFKNVRFHGCEYGNHNPVISITNWDEVKDVLPKSYKPCKVLEQHSN